MNVGTIIIAAAMMLSGASAVFFARSKKSSIPMQINAARRIYTSVSVLLLFSVILLLSALLNNEFQYAYVYGNSAKGMNMAYKIAALWAGNEGSYLVWILILNLMGLFLISRDRDNDDLVMTVVSVVQTLMLVILLVKNPFTKIWVSNPGFQPGEIPPNGLGMNPLLMDPWMIAHPPVLFMGYASSTVVFAYAIAALARKEYDRWIKDAYRWVMFSMLTLGFGIFLGGYWAYKVLGWGGYWGWDPVENSSLVPWVVCVALMHSMMLQQRKSVLKKTSLLLGLLYFILVFYSTFLTRSGVLSEFSVHSFQKSELALYLGIMLAAIVVFSMLLYLLRARGIESTALKTDLFNLENMTAFGIIVLGFYALVILAGTSMPIISKLIGTNPTPVTEKFYNNFSIPGGLMILAFIILSALSSIKYSKTQIVIAAVLSVIFSAAMNLVFSFHPAALSFLLLAAFLAQITVIDLYEKGKGIILSSRTAHLGVAVMVAGIIISGYYSWTGQHKINLSETAKAGNMDITLNRFNEGEKSSISLTLSRDGKQKEILLPYYIDANLEPIYKEPYIIPGISGDLYIAPQVYEFSSLTYNTGVIMKDQDKEIAGLKVRFEGFDTKNMGSEDMTILARVIINGKRYSPGLKFINREPEFLNEKIAGTDKTLSIIDLDVKHPAVMLHITKSSTDKIPPDYAIVDLSFKRMIWLVWLGTLLVSAGMIISIVRLARKD